MPKPNSQAASRTPQAASRNPQAATRNPKPQGMAVAFKIYIISSFAVIIAAIAFTILWYEPGSGPRV